jgi:hypothetical protein
MVLIVVTTWYPPEREEEVNKIYFSIPEKYPIDESLGQTLVPLGVKATKEGMKVITVFEVAKGKFDEAMELTAKILREFRSIEGYRYEIETMLSQAEAMNLIGMPIPA